MKREAHLIAEPQPPPNASLKKGAESTDTAPEMGTTGSPWRPLGELLVENGVITQEELARSLVEQATTGKRLGEVLISRGYSSRQAIQDALAEQCGVMFEPERGFGTGLRAMLAKRHEATRRPQEDEDPKPENVARPHAVAAENGGRVVDLLRHRATPSTLAGRLDDGAAVAVPNDQPDPAAPPDDIPAPALVQREAQLRLAMEELRRLGTTLAEREQELADERARASVLEEALEQREQPIEEPEVPEAQPVVAEHLRFVLNGSGYQLETHDGPAPQLGDRVDTNESPVQVLKIGPSPLPGDDRFCAYLLPVPRGAVT